MFRRKSMGLLRRKQFEWLMLPAMILILLAVVLAGCAQSTAPAQPPNTTSNSTQDPGTPASTISAGVKTLNGAGGTFIAPLATKWFDEYDKITGVKINYQAIGSGGGIQAITDGTVDFGESDAILTNDQQSKAEAAGGPILHIPMTSGAVAIIYKLQGISTNTLKLSSDVLAKIYLKTITKWNDPQIAALNPGLTLPDQDIAVVHRSDGSGTTYIFTNYLSKVSNDWKIKIGNAVSVNWPGDIGGEHNAGVAGQVQQIPGSIGYVEMAYAVQNNLPWALLQNAAGNYEKPSLQGVTNATVGVTLPDDMKVMITNSTNPDAYPICGFTWVLAYVNQKDQAKGTTPAKMLWWAIHDGQQYGNPLDYAPLSKDAIAKAENEILSMKYEEKPLLAR